MTVAFLYVKKKECSVFSRLLLCMQILYMGPIWDQKPDSAKEAQILPGPRPEAGFFSPEFDLLVLREHISLTWIFCKAHREKTETELTTKTPTQSRN